MPSTERSPLPLKFWIVALIAFINAVSFTIIIPILYPYAKLFGLSDFEASLLTTAYAVAQFIGTPILGKLSDWMGRKPLLIISLLGTVAANLMASLTPVAWLLFAARVLDGLTGGNTSIARAVISDTTTPAQRTRAFGIFEAMFRLGFVAGPALSFVAQSLPPLPGVTSLGMGFLLAAIMALVATILTVLLLPETHRPQQGLRLSWNDFGLAELVRSPLQPVVGPLFLLTLCSGATFTIFTFAFQPFFLNVLQQDAQTLAILFAAIGMLGFVTQVFALEPLRRQFHLMDILSSSLLARGVLFLLIPAFPQVAIFCLILTVFGVVNSFPMPIINAILSLASSERQQGEVLGINASYLSISNAIGPATAGLLVSLGYGTPFWVAGALTILTAGFAASLKSKLPVLKQEG